MRQDAGKEEIYPFHNMHREFKVKRHVKFKFKTCEGGFDRCDGGFEWIREPFGRTLEV